MRIELTERFTRAYRSLEAEDARRVDRALRMLAENPRQPGLRVKKMQGRDGVWEARASDSLRLTFELHGDVLLLRNVGAHDDALKNP
jgi:mRNA-degrading endonuclease RelE of RelBE toxin-antitoxin system